MHFRYDDFKLTNNDSRGTWVRLRELNYMIDHGVITVDKTALDEYASTVIEELNFMHSERTDEEKAKDLLGGEISESMQVWIGHLKAIGHYRS